MNRVGAKARRSMTLFRERRRTDWHGRFGVSRVAMRIRLEKLGLLLRKEPQQQSLSGLSNQRRSSSVNYTRQYEELNGGVGGRRSAFETRDFYLACFLRCAGYELLDLRAEGSRKVFVFQDRPTRREDVISFYGEGG